MNTNIKDYAKLIIKITFYKMQLNYIYYEKNLNKYIK